MLQFGTKIGLDVRGKRVERRRNIKRTVIAFRYSFDRKKEGKKKKGKERTKSTKEEKKERYRGQSCLEERQKLIEKMTINKVVRYFRSRIIYKVVITRIYRLRLLRFQSAVCARARRIRNDEYYYYFCRVSI